MTAVHIPISPNGSNPELGEPPDFVFTRDPGVATSANAASAAVAELLQDAGVVVITSEPYP